MNLEERFWKRVDKSGECWVWTGWHTSEGYGQVKRAGVSRKAHRIAYELTKGPIPEGLELDHLCRNRRCVNPDHLEPVTRKVNILRGEGTGARNARKTHCLRGHAFTEGNTYITRGGKRHCRECRTERRAALAADAG